MTITCSCSGDSPNDAGVSTPSRAWPARSGDTGKPYTVCGVSTRNATGWMGTSVPGGSTGRCTPFWPPCCTKLAMSEKFLSSGLYTALFAPMGRGSPTCAITTPISPAGTCTHGNFLT